jgi:hypothetical protein
LEDRLLHHHLGGLAHLVERLHGMQEAIGSNPLSSTRASFELQVLTDAQLKTQNFLQLKAAISRRNSGF